ncbi:hypothetical protein GGR92_001802 [Spirosoma lacussanchae]|uniref:O-antigen polymerase n=1 Tax=Spirosoma lacussanchae TaxID=1884249 RepID=UPI0011096D14|nr:O-antigen polymerase [Spirosoma lacussanchae]
MEHDADRRVVWYLLLAMAVAGLGLVWPADAVFVSTALLSLAGSGLGGVGLLRHPASRLNFFRVAAVTIGLFSSLGGLFSLLALSIQQAGLWTDVIEQAHTTSTDLALAQAYANAFALTLWLVGNRVQQTGRITRLHRTALAALTDHRRRLQGLVGLLLLTQGYLLAIGAVVYGGRDLAQDGAPTHPLLALTGPLVPVMPVVLGYYARDQYIRGRYRHVLLYGLLLTVELGWFFLFGRRSVFFFFGLAGLGILFDRPLSRPFRLKNSLALLLTAMMAFALADAYHRLRVVYRFEAAQRMSGWEMLTGLWQADTDEYSALRNRNLALRAGYGSLALGQFVNLFRTSSQSPLLGQQLVGSLLVATPSDFLVDKQTIEVKEKLYEHAFGIGLTDISETLYLESFVDFGGLGFIVYAGFLTALVGLVYRLASSDRRPVFALLTACVLVSLALSMLETDMITFLIGLRSVLVCYALAWLLSPKRTPAPQSATDGQNASGEAPS